MLMANVPHDIPTLTRRWGSNRLTNHTHTRISKVAARSTAAATQHKSFHTLPDGMRLEVCTTVPIGRQPGTVQGTPIILVHGSYHAAWCWQQGFASRLADSGGHTCHAISLRGQGASDKDGLQVWSTRLTTRSTHSPLKVWWDTEDPCRGPSTLYSHSHRCIWPRSGGCPLAGRGCSAATDAGRRMHCQPAWRGVAGINAASRSDVDGWQDVGCLPIGHCAGDLELHLAQLYDRHASVSAVILHAHQWLEHQLFVGIPVAGNTPVTTPQHVFHIKYG